MKKISLLSLTILTQAVFAQTVFPVGHAFAQQSPVYASFNSATPPATPKSSKEVIDKANPIIKTLEERAAYFKNRLVMIENELKDQLLNATDPGEKAKVEKEIEDMNKFKPELMKLIDRVYATAQKSKELVAKVESGEADSQALIKELSDFAQSNVLERLRNTLSDDDDNE